MSERPEKLETAEERAGEHPAGAGTAEDGKRAVPGYVETVVIGAGPGGLAASHALGERGLDHVVLERGDAAAAALATVDPDMRLVSPAPVSRLPEMESLRDRPTYIPFRDYVEILRRYRAQHELPVVTGVRVERVERVENGFRTHYELGGERRSVDSRFVVNATGIITYPELPSGFDPETTELRWFHSRDVRREHFVPSRRPLVVGGAISAANAIRDWLAVRRPGETLRLSLRSPLKVVPKRPLGIDVHYWTRLLERCTTDVPLVWRLFRRDIMTGLDIPAAIRRGDVVKVPGVARYEPRAVVLETGERLEPDLVVFATGYSYRAPHLGELLRWEENGRPRVKSCESLDAPGLFLMGLRFANTFASPYPRGMGDDAAAVTKRILGYRERAA